MNLHHLKYFLTIAEEGSLTAASKKLLVGQPALSAQLKQFEGWLGAKLFERRGKRLIITPAGDYVYKYAKAIKNLEIELLANFGHANDMKTRELVMGVQESVPKSKVASVISAIRKVGHVHLKIIEGTGDELFNLLLEGKVDVIITNFRPLSTSKEIFYSSLGKEAISVWGSPQFIKLKRQFPKSLDGQTFILPGFQNQIRHDFEKFMLQSGMKFEVVIEAQDTALQKELAQRGEGLMILGENSLQALAKSGALIKLGTIEEIKDEVWLGMVKKALDNDYIKLIMKSIV